ncbi:MAG: transposase [bacterium]|nr:transposase [bacterium]
MDIGQDTVRFAYQDYADGARKKEMDLPGTEFIRRFCFHILPPHFRKMRRAPLPPLRSIPVNRG